MRWRERVISSSSELDNNRLPKSLIIKSGKKKSELIRAMKFQIQLITVFLLCSNIWKIVSASRILAVFPFPLASHFILLNTVTVELAKRGHEVVVFSGFCGGNTSSELPNYRRILLEKNAENMPDISETFKDRNILEMWWEVFKISKTIGEVTIKHPEMTKMISQSSGEKFDLIIIEWIAWDALNALGHRFNAPVIGLLSVSANVFGGGAMETGLPFNMVDRPSYMDGNDGGKTFFQRLIELAMEIGTVGMRYYAMFDQQKIVKRYFGKDYPHVHDLVKNVSMIFGVQDHLMPYPTVSVPNIINMGGIHVRKEFDRVLPKDMEDFMANATEGVIYFSFGSTTKGIQISDKVRNIFLQTFAELPYRVLWKWENDTLPGKPENVFISKWMPQRAILDHPSIKLFIYQGGIQSTEEVISAGVPLVGIPLQGDQTWNVNKMVSVGAAVKLEIDYITKAKLKAAILEVMNNKKYKERMVQFRDLLNDRPYDPLENTMWWIEYAIRHKGAHHLKIARTNLPWYQSHHIDTLGFIFFMIFLTIIAILKIIKLIILRSFFSENSNASDRKQKRS